MSVFGERQLRRSLAYDDAVRNQSAEYPRCQHGEICRLRRATSVASVRAGRRSYTTRRRATMTAKIIRLPRRGRGPDCVIFAPSGPEPISAAQFEAELADLQAALDAPAPKPWWQVIWRRIPYRLKERKAHASQPRLASAARHGGVAPR